MKFSLPVIDEDKTFETFELELASPPHVKRVLTILSANRRRPSAKVKDRSEVRGGGKKPWRQKGTGRARAGSIRSPIWRGGGITFGPTTDRNFSRSLPKKERQNLLKRIIGLHAKEKTLCLVRSLPSLEKTKAVAKYLSDHQLSNKLLIVYFEKNEAFLRASRNIKTLTVRPAGGLSALDLLKADQVLFESKAFELKVGHQKPVKSRVKNSKANEVDQ